MAVVESAKFLRLRSGQTRRGDDVRLHYAQESRIGRGPACLPGREVLRKTFCRKDEPEGAIDIVAQFKTQHHRGTMRPSLVASFSRLAVASTSQASSSAVASSSRSALVAARRLPGASTPLRRHYAVSAAATSSSSASWTETAKPFSIGHLSPAQPKKTAKRLGRGPSSGRGGTSTRGHKGQKARRGNGKPTPGFEGGQTPLMRRYPKRGFVNA